jgi:hypothetical protein
LAVLGSVLSAAVGDVLFEVVRGVATLTARIRLIGSDTVYADLNAAAINVLSGTNFGIALNTTLLTPAYTVLSSGLTINSAEIYEITLRQSNVTDASAALCKIRVFSSDNATKTTVWVDWIY